MDPYLHIITRDPAWTPDPEAIARLRALLLAEEVAVEVDGSLMTGPKLGKLVEQTGPFFIDNQSKLLGSVPLAISVHPEPEYFFPAGTSFRASCPLCAGSLPLKDWQSAMQRWERSGKKNRLCMCKKCGRRSDLNDFRYRSTRGFSRLSIDIGGLHTANAALQYTFLEVLGDVLGTSLEPVLDQVDRGAAEEPEDPPAAPKAAPKAAAKARKRKKKKRAKKR